MAVDNLHFPYKIGESDTLTATLSDRGGVFNFTGYTVTMNVTKGSTALVVDAPCTANASGVVTCEISPASFEDVTLAEGNAKGEFKAVAGSDPPIYFPKNKDNKRTYFVFEIQRPLG